MNTHNYENGRQTDINAKNIELAQSIIHMIVSYKLVEYAEVEREREFVFNEIIDDRSDIYGFRHGERRDEESSDSTLSSTAERLFSYSLYKESSLLGQEYHENVSLQKKMIRRIIRSSR